MDNKREWQHIPDQIQETGFKKALTNGLPFQVLLVVGGLGFRRLGFHVNVRRKPLSHFVSFTGLACSALACVFSSF